MIFIGLDWPRHKHDFVLMNLQGDILDRGTIANYMNTLEEVTALCRVAPVTITSRKVRKVQQ